jgi:GNAT superfamily N-acetyltransferase
MQTEFEIIRGCVKQGVDLLDECIVRAEKGEDPYSEHIGSLRNIKWDYEVWLEHQRIPSNDGLVSLNKLRDKHALHCNDAFSETMKPLQQAQLSMTAFMAQKIKRTTNPQSFLKFQKAVGDKYSGFLLKWANETKPVVAYYAVQQGHTYGFALLHKSDMDPFGTHADPYVLDLVYVVPKYRRNGIGKTLMTHITQRHQITSFCNKTETAVLRLHLATGCSRATDVGDNVVMRHPA